MKLNKTKRMMCKLLFKYVLILGVYLISYTPVSSKPDDTELKQTLEKAFKVDKSVNLSLYNKYGDVVVRTWDTDSVKIFIEITAYGKKLDDVKKTLGKVDFDFDHTGKFLTIATIINRKSSSTPSFWSDLGDKFGKDKPAVYALEVSITNSFSLFVFVMDSMVV